MSPPPCIVHLCHQTGTHIFPSDETRRAQWIRAIEHIKPGLTVRKFSRICSAHFKPTDFNRTPLSLLQSDIVPKTLKKTAIPSIFPWKKIENESPSTSQDPPESPVISQDPPDCSSTSEDPPTIKHTAVKKTYARAPRISFVEEQPYWDPGASNVMSKDPLLLSDESSDIDEPVDAEDNIFKAVDVGVELEIPAQEFQEGSLTSTEKMDKWVQTDDQSARGFSIHNYKNNDTLTSTEKMDEWVQTDDQSARGFSIHNYKNNDKAIHFYTGLENIDKVMLVFNTLGECAYKLNYFYGQPPKDLDPLEHFFITLIILRRHKEFEEIAMIYQITVKQVYNIFITWIRFMSLQWKNIDLWLDKDSVKAYMPFDFYDKYPSTRVVLDATECPIRKPKLPLAQQVTFSSYKNRNTVKVLIGITPSGLISYVSPCYGGSATDRQIIERSDILTKFNYNDEIMVDKGLNVQDIFIPFGVKVNMPSFFKKGNQIGPTTLTANRKVASKRVHVERVIGLLKTYKILCRPMNQTETLLSSDIVFICAMLVNFRSSIITKNA